MSLRLIGAEESIEFHTINRMQIELSDVTIGSNSRQFKVHNIPKFPFKKTVTLWYYHVAVT